MSLTLIGLGVNSGDITLRAYEKIKNAKTVILRTGDTVSSEFLASAGISYITLDDEYKRSRSFDTLNKNLSKRVAEFLKGGDVCYLVEGSVCEDSSCRILLEKYRDAEVFEGVSKAVNALNSCKVKADGYTAFSAYNKDEFKEFSFPLVIFDLDSAVLASEWKLKLMEYVGDEQKVWLYVDNQPKLVPIYELDRFDGYNYSTAVIIEKVELVKRERFNFNDLYEIVKLLRAPGGCPWDRVQTKESIRKNLVEECYELCDAIDQNDDDKILEEIGDVLLQAVFHMIFAEERGAFSRGDVLTDECKKLIFRHSHIFGTDKVEKVEGALDVWDKNKQIEKGFNNAFEYVNDVPKCFPSLLRAQKVIKRIEKSTSEKVTLDALTISLKNLLDKVDKNTSRDTVGSILLIASYIAKLLDFDGEESLYFAIDKLVNEYKDKWDKNFSLGEYINS